MKVKSKHITTDKKQMGRFLQKLISLTLIAILLCNPFSTANMIAFAATDAVTYYQYTEKQNLDKQIDRLTKSYATYISDYQNALKSQIGQEATLQATIDSSLTDGTSFEGIQSLKVAMVSMVRGKNSKSDIKISCNDQELTSLEFFTCSDLYYLLIPDLSKDYLKLDLNKLGGYASGLQSQNSVEEFLNDPVSADLLNQLMKKYANMVIKRIDNVTMENDNNLNIENVEASYTKLTATINEENSLEIARAILTSAKNDDDLINLCTRVGICTKDEFVSAINEELVVVSEKITALKKGKSQGDNVITMNVWVDSQGDITGRSFEINSEYDKINMGYRTAKNGIKMGIEGWINSNGEDIVRGTGNLSAGLLGASGNFKITYPGSDNKSTKAINIDFKNIKFTKNDMRNYLNGEVTVSGDDLNGMSFYMNCVGESGKQDMLFNILQDKKSIATISAMVKEIPYTDFDLPSSADKIYDMDKENQLTEFIKNSDMKGYLEGIKAKSKVDCIDAYIDTLMADQGIAAELK